MLLRRQHITIFWQVLFVLLTFTSCVSDKFADDLARQNPATHTKYLTIQVKFDTDGWSSSRRAPINGDNLEYGNEEEHLIGKRGNYVILFSGKGDEQNKKLFGIYELTSLTTHNHPSEDPEDDNITDENKNNIEAIYTYSSKIETTDGDLPEDLSCLVIFNGSEAVCDKIMSFNDREDATLQSILDIVWYNNDDDILPRKIGYSDADDDNNTYFTMTNAIYFDNNTKQSTVDIPEDFIGSTLATAKPLIVRVERMVSKFSFELPNSGNIFQPNNGKADMKLFGDGYNADGSPKEVMKKWRIKLTGWNINALETNTYLYKKVENKDYFSDYTDSDWNHPANYRSHWSEDSHYDIAETYPWQYREAIDYTLEDYQKNIIGNSDENMLRNYSFKELGLGELSQLNDDLAETFTNKIIYTPENTYDASSVAGSNKKKHDQRDELLAGTHLLVGAELQIEQGDLNDDYFIVAADEDYKTPQHLYRDHDGVFYLSERSCIASLVHNFNQLLESNSRMEFTHYPNWDSYNAQTSRLIAITEGSYSLYYQKDNENWEKLTDQVILKTGNDEVFSDKDLRMPIATIRRGDGKRLPWIEKLLNENKLKIGKEDGNGVTWQVDVYPAIESEEDYGNVIPDMSRDPLNVNENNNNSLIKSIFYEWLGAVDHFDGGKMYYSHGVVDNPPIEKDKTIRYGAVRNNWYQFRLDNINSLGTPVDDVDQPIVPERNGLNDQVNFTIKIIDWHYVQTELEWSKLNSN